MIQRATAATPRLMYLIIRRSSLKTPEPTTNAASLTAPQSNARRRTLRLSNTLGFYFEYSPSWQGMNRMTSAIHGFIGFPAFRFCVRSARMTNCSVTDHRIFGHHVAGWRLWLQHFLHYANLGSCMNRECSVSFHQCRPYSFAKSLSDAPLWRCSFRFVAWPSDIARLIALYHSLF